MLAEKLAHLGTDPGRFRRDRSRPHLGSRPTPKQHHADNDEREKQRTPGRKADEEATDRTIPRVALLGNPHLDLSACRIRGTSDSLIVHDRGNRPKLLG
ncbi:hypothetical protein FRUB_07039 [Fimbriiglobus ruber]|uniref:Uncharacterized protein n=1 Tax=Fimbriiglobus ruber TaxID=1908690 RepID=A0A225DL75_9BACT|nr:hypothetical protein FRUB_07039 [Fimbriiglobus ruber]